MLLQAFILVAFGCHILPSGLCTMPTTSAMVVSHEMPEDDQPTKKAQCASEHCVSALASDTLFSPGTVQETRITALPNTSYSQVPDLQSGKSAWQFIAEGPPAGIGIATIVLRQ